MSKRSVADEAPARQVVVPVIHGNIGWLYTPNRFFDDLFPLLSGEHVKVLFYMWRKTKGWNKWEDCISLSQMARDTGVCRNTATAAAKLFVELGMFSDVGGGVRGARRYRLASEFDMDKIVVSLKGIPQASTKAPAHPMSTTCSPHEQVTCSPHEHTINSIENTYQEDSASSEARRPFSSFGGRRRAGLRAERRATDEGEAAEEELHTGARRVLV